MTVHAGMPAGAPAATPAPFMPENGGREHRLLESLICDFQRACLNAATIAYLIKGSHRRGMDLRLGAWRHMLYDNTSIAHLGLRYGADLGLPDVASSALTGFYDAFSRAMVDTSALLKTHGVKTTIASRMLQPLGPGWEVACNRASQALKHLESIVHAQLTVEYSDNSRILQAFLAEAMAADTRRLNEWGEISLPALAQRRSHPRSRAGQPCRLLHAGRTIAARLDNVSRGGLGLSCGEPLPVGSRVSVVLAEGRELTGCIVRWDDAAMGVKLDLPLALDDSLFGA